MTIYSQSKVKKIGNWYRVYVLTKKGWEWYVATLDKKHAKKITIMVTR